MHNLPQSECHLKSLVNLETVDNITAFDGKLRHVYDVNMNMSTGKLFLKRILNLKFFSFPIRITLLMLRLLSSKAQGRKYFRKPLETCHVGIYWKALGEYFHMSTHLPGFRSFFRFFCIIMYWPN